MTKTVVLLEMSGFHRLRNALGDILALCLDVPQPFDYGEVHNALRERQSDHSDQVGMNPGKTTK